MVVSIRELLDEECELSNEGKGDSRERQELLTLIRLKRDPEPPFCFGDDDCSTEILSMCPWRMDCGN